MTRPHVDQFRVCAYNATGRWQPAVEGVPGASRSGEGWLNGGDAAAIAALVAAENGSHKVVVVDVSDCSVMEIEGGEVVFPPELAREANERGAIELRQALQRRLYADFGRADLLGAGVAERTLDTLGAEWMVAAGVEVTRSGQGGRAWKEDGVMVAVDWEDQVGEPEVVVVTPRAVDAVALLSRNRWMAAFVTVGCGDRTPSEVAKEAVREQLARFHARGAAEVVVAGPCGVAGARFVDAVKELVPAGMKVRPELAPSRQGWFEALDPRNPEVVGPRL